MSEADIFNIWYGKLGLFGILCLVVWKVYHDMRADRNESRSRLYALESQFSLYRSQDHERIISTLEHANHSRERLAQSLDRLSRATESLPCNQSQPSESRFVTPTYGTPTPPHGTQQ